MCALDFWAYENLFCYGFQLVFLLLSKTQNQDSYLQNVWSLYLPFHGFFSTIIFDYPLCKKP